MFRPNYHSSGSGDEIVLLPPPTLPRRHRIIKYMPSLVHLPCRGYVVVSDCGTLDEAWALLHVHVEYCLLEGWTVKRIPASGTLLFRRPEPIPGTSDEFIIFIDSVVEAIAARN